MRIALDLQPCQTASRRRGIGRYTLDFTRALISRPQGAELLIGLDGTYPREAGEVVAGLEGLVPRAAFSRYFYPGPSHGHGDEADALRPVANMLVASHYASLSADIVHANSLFEGFVEHAGGISGLTSVPNAISSVTVYDFIPLIYAEKYLSNPEHRAWYMRRLAALQKFDLMLCISETTRSDAIRLLGIEPDRLAVIYAGIEPKFVPGQWDSDRKSRFLRRLGITGRFVLYTGNGDFRKNLRGAIEAFARLPKPSRKGVQLVLNQIEDESSLRQFAERSGLTRNDLVITGAVSDEDLVGLFQTCEVFFFPSLYEGFGLPVLEAMACGAPTISANNSSLKEIVVRPDAMFDASNVNAASELLGHVLNDSDFRNSLRETGLLRAKEFSWERSAALAHAAWREAAERKKRVKVLSNSGNGLRRRVAMVTPLPPERTGIADYATEVLLPLSRYFDIDLFTTANLEETGDIRYCFRISHWSLLPSLAGRYDAVVYQFGNSPFHMHMLDLLDEIPGVVVLHDIYLSSLLAYMDEYVGNSGVFAAELLRSHGRGAVDLLARDGVQAARARYPASLRVLQSASAVLVHSAHSAEIIKNFFPIAHRSKILQAPMPLRVSVALNSTDRKKEIRERLGIANNECVVVSFGFLADTKLNHVVLDALSQLDPVHRKQLRMVFVGQNDGGRYGENLTVRIAELADDLQIQVTGFADEQLYRDYLLAGDIAIQLRAGSRGETSKAVYDCLAYGLPTIINDYGSFCEIPSQCVRKLPPEPDGTQLAQALIELITSLEIRQELCVASLDYIKRFHSPDITSQAYVQAIEEAVNQRVWRSGDALVHGLASAFEAAPPGDRELAAVEHAISLQNQAQHVPRLLLDLSELVTTDHKTGVHRVVRNLAREALLQENPTLLQIEAVAHDHHGHLSSAEDYAQSALGVPVAARGRLGEWTSNDILMLLDSAWEVTTRFDASRTALQAVGGRVGAIVYDLIPVRYPQYCVDYMPEVFESWLRYVIKHCDFLLCISRATADDLHSWIGKVSPERRAGQRIGYMHLGSDLVEGHVGEKVSPRLKEALWKKPVLMVGTIEPRKGYQDALDAFEQAWKKDADLSLLLIGKQGWNVEALTERILNHPEFGKRLFWLERASDEDLRHAYAGAGALLQSSHAEGFGLPIVEAAKHGLPLLLSDIPPFREIAGDNARFYPAGDSLALMQLLSEPFPNPPPRDLGISWRQSADAMVEIITRGGWIY